MSEMAHVTQHVIDTLYTDIKTSLIHHAKVTTHVFITNVQLILVVILKD